MAASESDSTVVIELLLHRDIILTGILLIVYDSIYL